MSEPLITTVAQESRAGDKGLKKGAIGLVGSVVVATASTAPAYSLAASLGFIVATGGGDLLAGLKSPAVIILAFIPMYFIAQAYKELNQTDPDCGTTFTWATRAFGAVTGWMGGWAIIIADVIVMANLAYIAGQYTFVFIGGFGLPAVAALGANVWASTILGLLWIALMTWICYRGIEISARMQYALLGFELVLLLVFALTALIRVGTGQGESYSIPFDWSWFNPMGMDFANVLAPALLTAIFIYWGWDSAVAVNEETKDPGRTPGRAAVLSTVLLLATYLLVTVATISFAGVGTKGVGLGNPANVDDVFSAMAPEVFGSSAIGHVLQVLFAATILTSAAASTQTTILPTARTSLSMAVHKAMPAAFARMHPRFLTPTWSTIGMGIASCAFFLLFTLISQNLLAALIGSLGLMIAFYYGLTGLACVWFYRRTLLTSPRNFVFRGLFPFLGAAFLAVIFVYGVQQYALPDWLTDDDGGNVTIFGIGATAVVGIVGLLVGFVLIALYWRRGRAFFSGRVIPRAPYVEGQPVRDPNRVLD
ncbi:APC family permease [Amnibacterium setariae]|uniref:APC family permease n=1 Tax=Amnibacterium setariae TaxID=2306585 RepID=UPI0018F6CA27|nr:APC family permease [Amnibacterium setariae]